MADEAVEAAGLERVYTVKAYEVQRAPIPNTFGVIPE